MLWKLSSLCSCTQKISSLHIKKTYNLLLLNKCYKSWSELWHIIVFFNLPKLHCRTAIATIFTFDGLYLLQCHVKRMKSDSHYNSILSNKKLKRHCHPYYANKGYSYWYISFTIINYFDQCTTKATSISYRPNRKKIACYNCVNVVTILAVWLKCLVRIILMIYISPMWNH
jgi:hypothetical protein